MGEGARAFADFLHEAGMAHWQVLPLGPTGYGDSPYQSFSAFAGNTLLISPEGLVGMGLLTQADIAPFYHGGDPRWVDYNGTATSKAALLRKAMANFRGTREYVEFLEEHAYWLEDYALFVALKAHFISERAKSSAQKGKSADYSDFYSRAIGSLSQDQVQEAYLGALWNTWPPDIRTREAGAMARYRDMLARDIEFVRFGQYVFDVQWRELHAYCKGLGIEIMGDMPIFVAMDSSDVWAHPHLFDLDEGSMPRFIAGVPPDYFSDTGQLWGNPLYNWEACASEDYAWWVARMKKMLSDTDTTRVDHFRGFESYWAVPFGEETAVSGSWMPGPGAALFAAFKRELGELPIVAEDLGVITPEVEQLRVDLGFPGMRILQFAFGDDAENTYLPHNYEINTVVYSGTHDNDTTAGWYASAPEGMRDLVRRYLNTTGEDISWDMIRLAFSSVALLAIVPMQDVHISHQRMNTPGQATGNWLYRTTMEDINPRYAQGLRYLAEMYNRTPKIKNPSPTAGAPDESDGIGC